MKIFIYMSVFFIMISSCNTSQKADGTINPDSIYQDEYYTELFNIEGDGFTGGDGTYSVELPDGRTAWIFGDTFIGGVNPDNTRRKEKPMYIRNSVVVQEGDSLRTIFSQKDGQRASFVYPPDVGDESVSEDSIWFWPGDAYIENGDFHLFLSEFTQVDTGMWDFRWEGTWLAVYELPGFIQKSITHLPQGKLSGVHFGHAVYVNKEFTYIYGAKEGQPHVARYPAGNFEAEWEYFNGSDWDHDFENAKPMADISGSEQFSVFRLKDQYILVTQMGWFSVEICSFTSRTPYGPWENQTVLYNTPIPYSTGNIFTYNALAHPHLINDGKILISYNMNSMVLEDHFKNADIYRPRFIRVPLEDIDPALAE